MFLITLLNVGFLICELNKIPSGFSFIAGMTAVLLYDYFKDLKEKEK